MMFYFEAYKEHVFVWPALAVSLSDEFWIGIGWLNFEIGWRSGDGGSEDGHFSESKDSTGLSATTQGAKP